MQQQQSADYDLMAVFPNEPKAIEATEKLHKAGFTADEVHRLTTRDVGRGEFREHGPNRSRAEFFLQRQHAGPNPWLVISLALCCALIFGGLAFGSAVILPGLNIGYNLIIGLVVGLIIGAMVGLLRRGRVRGEIGQRAAPAVPTSRQMQAVRNVVALRFTDPDNISRKSRARAILINNEGKIDRSVGRRE